MEKILVPCDGSRHALRAVQFAAAEGSARPGKVEVDLLFVLPAGVPAAASAWSAGALDSRFPPEAWHALQAAAAMLAQAGVPHQLHYKVGDSATAIVDHVHTNNCATVVMGTRGSGRLASAVLGSVTSAVLHLIDVPVTLVRHTTSGALAPRAAGSGPAPTRTRMLLACDASDSAQRAAAYASSIVQAHPETEVALLHVLDPMTFHPPAGRSSPEDLVRLSPDELAQALHRARQALDAAGVPYQVRCRLGDPGSEILAEAYESACDRILMGTRGMTPVAKLFIGSVAAHVVQFARVPVTLIK